MSHDRSVPARGRRPKPAEAGAGAGAGADAALTVRPSGVLAFVVEVAMLVLLAEAGWRIGGGSAVALIRAVAFVGIATAVWAVWLAPRAPRRLGRRPRLVVKAVLFAATAVLAALTGLVGWGVGFAVVAAISLAWGRD